MAPERFCEEIRRVCDRMYDIFRVERLYVFGVKQKGEKHEVTDFDICVVADFKEEDRRALLRRAYTETDSDIPFDIFLYTAEQFAAFSADTSSFVSRVLRQGWEYDGEK